MTFSRISDCYNVTPYQYTCHDNKVHKKEENELDMGFLVV